MEFQNTLFAGVYVVRLEPKLDERGYFMRTFCRRTFEERGLVHDFPQCNLVWSKEQGTLRGMHYTVPPVGEVKVVQCVRGSAFDVLLDLRPASPTFGKWQSFDLTAERPELLYIPKGVAQGYQTLQRDTCMYYLMSEEYVPGLDHTVRWDDPAFRIPWPIPNPILSARDRQCPDFPVPPVSQSASDE